ncbi:basic salivary proline-rich protein 2-like [Ammospiza nelsoni]|uniref:basic salivary proline-rich protein 2-like n=1 Tax=Ammospiza nelsoni TaxID=2857394 RepID=UPI00286BE16F|nr:basic salivary proline-rich protein 2-like [Ammospiza nelsoni]
MGHRIAAAGRDPPPRRGPPLPPAAERSAGPALGCTGRLQRGPHVGGSGPGGAALQRPPCRHEGGGERIPPGPGGAGLGWAGLLPVRAPGRTVLRGWLRQRRRGASKIFSVLPAHPKSDSPSLLPALTDARSSRRGKMLRSPGDSSSRCPSEPARGKRLTAASPGPGWGFGRPRAGRGDRRGSAARCPHGAPPAPPLTATAPGPAPAAPPPANGHSAAAPANQSARLCPPSRAIGWLSTPAITHWLLPATGKPWAPPPCLPQSPGSSSARVGHAPFLQPPPPIGREERPVRAAIGGGGGAATLKSGCGHAAAPEAIPPRGAPYPAGATALGGTASLPGMRRGGLLSVKELWAPQAMAAMVTVAHRAPWPPQGLLSVKELWAPQAMAAMVTAAHRAPWPPWPTAGHPPCWPSQELLSGYFAVLSLRHLPETAQTRQSPSPAGQAALNQRYKEPLSLRAAVSQPRSKYHREHRGAADPDPARPSPI